MTPVAVAAALLAGIGLGCWATSATWRVRVHRLAWANRWLWLRLQERHTYVVKIGARPGSTGLRRGGAGERVSGDAPKVHSGLLDSPAPAEPPTWARKTIDPIGATQAFCPVCGKAPSPYMRRAPESAREWFCFGDCQPTVPDHVPAGWSDPTEVAS